MINRAPEGPTAAQLDAGWTAVWGEAADGDGHRVEARLRGPEAYRFTALTAVAVARRVLDFVTNPGFRTPAGVYGAGLVEEIDDVRIST